MKNLNEGKKIKSSYMAELAEIDKQSALVAMETKISALEEMAKAKETRLEMVNEDENLSELISKSAVKEMRRDIKEINKAKLKLEKLYEKASGSKPSKVIDEDMNELPDKIAKLEKEKIERDARRLEEEEVEETYSTPTYEEDEDGVKETSYPTYEEDDVEVSEEMSKSYSEDGDTDMDKRAQTIRDREKAQIEMDARRLEESNNEEINRFKKLAGL